MQLVKEDGKTEEIPVDNKEDNDAEKVDAVVENEVNTNVETMDENLGNQETAM